MGWGLEEHSRAIGPQHFEKRPRLANQCLLNTRIQSPINISDPERQQENLLSIYGLAIILHTPYRQYVSDQGSSEDIALSWSMLLHILAMASDFIIKADSNADIASRYNIANPGGLKPLFLE